MKIAYARTPLPKTIFLAGPTPKSSRVDSWRPEALAILESAGFDGTVLVPEDSDQSWRFSYDDQVEWELQGLHSATVIAFWVPRTMLSEWEPRELKMPALTTNVEFGLFASRRNIVLGYPANAEKMKYLEAIATMYNLRSYDSLKKTMLAAVRMAERPFPTSHEA